jgi:hypothetical protein
MKLRVFASLSALLLVSACDAGKAPSTRPPAPRAAPTVAAQPRERDALSLPERLAFESSQHPDAVQLVERALESFEQGGVKLTRKRQVLARMLDAQYCQGAVSSAGVGLSLCVFADAEGARRGSDSSHAHFDRLIPGRTLVVHARTLLTLTQPANNAARSELEVIQKRFLNASMSKHAAL